jgi:hypothetical protein
MGVRIVASAGGIERELTLDDDGILLRSPSVAGGTRRFPLASVDCLLLSTKGVLTFQVGSEVFAVPLRKDDREHQAAVAALARALGQERNA